MGIKIRQSIPDFVSGVERQEFENIDPEKIFEVEFIKKWGKSPDFIRFMISDDAFYTDRNMSLLMVEIKDDTQKSKKSYCVIAFLSPYDEVVKLNLPVWNSDDYKDPKNN